MVSLSSFFYLLLLQQMLQVVIACDALQFIPVSYTHLQSPFAKPYLTLKEAEFDKQLATYS